MKSTLLPRTLLLPLSIIFFSLALVTAVIIFAARSEGQGELKNTETAVQSMGETPHPKSLPPRPGIELEPRWTFDVGGYIEYPPVVDGGRVFVTSHADVLYALDLRSGRKLWRYRPPAGHLWDPSPTMLNGILFAAYEGGHLLALDPDKGNPLWDITLNGEVRSQPVMQDGIIYVSTAHVGGRMTNNPDGKAVIYALRPEDGSIVWRYVTDNFLLRGPSVHGNTVYVGGSFIADRDTPDGEGGWTRIYAFDARDGVLKWTREFPDGMVKTMKATGDIVAYIPYADVLRALDAETGEDRWTYHTENWTYGFTDDGERFFFGSANGFVHAVDAATGNGIWKYDTYGVFNYIVGRPVLMDSVLYYQTTYYEIWALDADTGDLLWWNPVGIPTYGSLQARDGMLLMGSNAGILYAWDAPKSR